MEVKAGSAERKHRFSTNLVMHGQDLERRTWRMAFLTTSIVLLLLPLAAAADSSDDVACLREFKESVTDPLGYLRNWDFRGGKVNICDFVGVTCDDERQVQKLNLAAAGLRGRFPQGLTKCSHLRDLNLSNNFLTGRVPPTVCVHNRNLVTLDLSYNAFSKPFPPSLQRCLDSNKRRLDSYLEELNQGAAIEMFPNYGGDLPDQRPH